MQNIEQGRYKPKPLALLVLAAIELDPDLMARAAKAVNDGRDRLLMNVTVRSEGNE